MEADISFRIRPRREKIEAYEQAAKQKRIITELE